MGHPRLAEDAADVAGEVTGEAGGTMAVVRRKNGQPFYLELTEGGISEANHLFYC